MATWIHFLLFFKFALCVLSTRSIQDQAKQNLPTIEIINSLPANLVPWKIVEKNTYYCAAEWKNIFHRGMGLKYLEMRIMELCIRW
ncbi:hypothetical protein NC652_041604 [Populus alba x Populus x berolinensis]|nr:hypothetical protein NC652_041604 [Populus alba x Populus x berolinensis]